MTDRQAGLTLGFLTVLHDAAGFTGGYLVTNAWGRPLEFRLTTPVQPNRVQATFKLVTTTSTDYAAYFNPPGTEGAGVGVFARNAPGWDEQGGRALQVRTGSRSTLLSVTTYEGI